MRSRSVAAKNVDQHVVHRSWTSSVISSGEFPQNIHFDCVLVVACKKTSIGILRFQIIIYVKQIQRSLWIDPVTVFVSIERLQLSVD